MRALIIQSEWKPDNFFLQMFSLEKDLYLLKLTEGNPVIAEGTYNSKQERFTADDGRQFHIYPDWSVKEVLV